MTVKTNDLKKGARVQLAVINPKKGVKMADFQRRHYEAVAKIIKERYAALVPLWNENTEYCRVASLELVLISDAFSQLFRADNVNFDRNRFLDACGNQN